MSNDEKYVEEQLNAIISKMSMREKCSLLSFLVVLNEKFADYIV